MLEALNTIIMAIADPLFNWLLALPTDVILIIVGFGTGAILTLARLFTTNQDLLRRCDEDKKVLAKQLKAAKKAGDKERVKAIQACQGGIAMKAFRAEGKPMLLALIPIALLGTWCFQRIGYHPPKEGETVKVEAFFPISAADQVVHLVPQDGLETESGWVTTIVPVPDSPDGVPHGLARWHVKGKARPEPYALQVRYREDTYEMPFLVGQRTYTPEVQMFDASAPVLAMQQYPEEVKLFGVVPGFHPASFPLLQIGGWLVAYMLIAVPSVFLTKWLFRIH